MRQEKLLLVGYTTTEPTTFFFFSRLLILPFCSPTPLVLSVERVGWTSCGAPLDEREREKGEACDADLTAVPNKLYKRCYTIYGTTFYMREAMPLTVL